MYGSPGNSLIAGCLMKWPWLIPVAMIGAGGLVYETCVGPAPVVAVAPPPTVVAPPPEPPKPVVVVPPEAPKVVEPPKPVEPAPLPPKKKIKG